MLKIENLKASIGEVEILKGVDLEIKPGELHAVMGPCLLYTSPSPRDRQKSRMPSSA